MPFVLAVVWFSTEVQMMEGSCDVSVLSPAPYAALLVNSTGLKHGRARQGMLPYVSVGCGTVRYRSAGHNAVRYGTRHGMVRHIRYDSVLYCTVLYGTVRYCTVRYRSARHIVVRYGKRYGMIRHIRHGTIRYCTVRYVSARYGTTWRYSGHDPYIMAPQSCAAVVQGSAT